MRKSGKLLKSWEAGAILLVTLLAAILRLYRLPDLPPGLHFDEGFKGVTARALLEGAPPQLFFESDMGEEPIAMYLVAAALGLLGYESWIIRLPSAIVGTLTIPLAWWLGRELLGRSPRLTGRGCGSKTAKPTLAAGEAEAPRPAPIADPESQILGLGTALVLAILYWHLSFSRIGMEPILVPFFATLAFAALARGLNIGRWPPFVLAGLALGASLYTYKAGYFVPIVAVLFVGCATIMSRGFLRRHGRGLLLAALIGLLVAAPITGYFVTHPANFVQRPASVALAGTENAQQSPWQALGDNLPAVLGMFFMRGDTNPRSNSPGRPALDPFLALLFLIGLIRAMVEVARGQYRYALPLIWLGVMTVPTLVTEHAPHFGRAIGAIPALAILCAMGGWTLLGIGDRGPMIAVHESLRARIGNPRPIIATLLALGMVLSGASTVRAYFVAWGQSPDLFYAYDVGLTQVAEVINSIPAEEDVYLSPTSSDHYTLQFLTRRSFRSFDGRWGLIFPPPAKTTTIIVLLREDGETLPALQEFRPDGTVTWTTGDDYDRPYAAAYRLPASDAPAPSPDQTIDNTFGHVARLLGYSLDAEAVTSGDSVNLTLYWQALAPVDKDYTVFTHLLGDPNPATNGPLWAGHDSQPDDGHYPTTAWQPGQVILDRHPLTIPSDAPAGDYQLEVGLYLLANMSRLPAMDGYGNPLPDDAAILGMIEIGD